MRDEILEELWQIKDEIAKEAGYDIDVLLSRLQKMQQASSRTTINRSAPQSSDKGGRNQNNTTDNTSHSARQSGLRGRRHLLFVGSVSGPVETISVPAEKGPYRTRPPSFASSGANPCGACPGTGTPDMRIGRRLGEG